MSDLVSRLGQLFVVGFAGEQPPADLLHFVAEEKIGGVILFGDSCSSVTLVRDNIEKIRQALKGARTPFIAVDQEGGRVSRIKGAPAEIQAASEYGSELGLEKYEEDYRRSAVYLESIGFNLNLAPVADIGLDPDNTCLEGRTFGDNTEQVETFVRRTVELSRGAGLLSCLKHFPGLGAARIDPHKALAEADYDELIWQQREMLPFRAGIEAGADMVMSTHLRISGFGEEIATANGMIVRSLLRDRLAFDGPVVTDDLTMQGAAGLGTYGERAVKAFSAGHDLLLFGPNHEAAMEAYDFFENAVRHGEIPAERVRRSLERVVSIKLKLDSSVIR